MAFKDIGAKKLFEGRMLKLWEETVDYPDGRRISLEVIHHPGSVVILPLDADGQIWFTYQYRHPARQMLLELPAGTLESGELPENCALRELQEEIGMAANSMQKLGSMYLAPGYSNEHMHVFMAQDLYPSILERDIGEFIEIQKYSISEIYTLLDKGEILDAKTAAVLGMVRARLGY